MDGIFSNEIANTLQMFTFPLEVIGLTLAAIEVRYPDAARLITQVVAFQDSNTTLKSFTGRWKNTSDFPTFRYRLVILVMLLVTLVVIDLPTTLSLVLLGCIIFFMIRLTNRWVPERSVGTLGIIIAGFGVLGEAYQFTTLMLT